MKRLLVITALATLIPVAGASAATYCISDPACVTAGGTSEPDIQSAFTDASPSNGNNGPNTVLIGPGTFTGPFSYSGNTITVKGSGVGATTLASGGNNAVGLAVQANAASSISDLSLTVTSGTNTDPLLLTNGTANDIAVMTPASDDPATGVSLDGTATLTNSTVTVGATSTNSKAVHATGNNILQDDTLSAPVGVLAEGANSVLQRDRISASAKGYWCFGGTCAVQDSLISMTGGNGYTVVAECSSSADASLSATNDTVLGAAAISGFAWCQNASRTATLNVDSSIIGGATNALWAEADGAGTTAVIHPTYDDYDFSTDTTSGTGTHTISDPGPGQINADPLFLNPGAGDYRIPYNSPAVDAGNSAALGLLESTTDLAGKPRVINGHRDVGAYEYQRQPPVASITQSATTAASGQPVKFDGSAASDPDPGEIVTYAWTFDDGATATSAVVSHAFATPGSHLVTLKVTDPTGLTGTAHATVTVPVMVPNPAPIITGLTESAATWREGSAQAQFARKHRHPIGTTFGFALNVPASVQFRFIESLGGRKVRRKCVPKTHANRHRPTCTRTTVAGTLTFQAQAGPHTLRFDGRLSASSRLATGKYTMVASATDSSGRTSPPTSIHFKIARR
jgi:hypothetical protein